MSESEIIKYAEIIWDYMCINDKTKHSDVIMAFGSTDNRTAEKAAQLYKEGVSTLLLMSGGHGRLTQHDKQSEAERYRDIALRMGIPPQNILVENKSSNSGENIAFSYELLKANGMLPKTITIVHKPYMQRRTFATFKKQWPDKSALVNITAPEFSFVEYLDDYYTQDYVINVMVGDLQRIKEYPKLGFQIEQEIPNKVWDAYRKLINQGYTKSLLS